MSQEHLPPVPLILLTGFLGAGKTTVLNRVLAAQHRHRVAVIVNELGRIDIDGKLLKARAGDIVELAGGCVCHEVRTQEELWEALQEVMLRSRPERIVLETTGIAEPQPILEGLRNAPPDRLKVEAAAVVTVVDAEAGLGQLERFAEARAQVEVADRLLLSKLDLVGASALASLHVALDGLNREAERAAFPATDGGARDLVPWLLDRPVPGGAGQRGRGHRHAHAHAHGQLTAVAFSDEAPLVGEALLALCGRLESALVRVKGFVHLAGEPRRGFLERAGLRTELRLAEPWGAETPRSQIVFIGEGLDPGAVQRELWACRVERRDE